MLTAFIMKCIAVFILFCGIAAAHQSHAAERFRNMHATRRNSPTRHDFTYIRKEDIPKEVRTFYEDKANSMKRNDLLFKSELDVYGNPDSNTVMEDPMVEYFARQRRLDDSPSSLKGITCDVCEFIIQQVRHMIEEQRSIEFIVKESIQICILFQIEDERVCNMIVPLFRDEVMYVVEHLVLSPKEVCGILLGDTCAVPYYPGQMWNVTLPNTIKPAPKPPTPPQPQAPTLRILHFSDIHLDLQYLPNTKVECGEPVCCRANDNATFAHHVTDPETAGKYGSYDYCDAPLSLTETMFKFLNTIQDQFDFVYFTGDIPAHDVWNQSQSDQISHLVVLDDFFTKYLPNKPVYYCVGNHESSPVNSFPPPGIPEYDNSWLYGAMTGIWGKWLPESAMPTLVRCGGFSVSPYPGFRLISLNNNYCNNGNFWLFLNQTDPCDVLQWLIQELQTAEDQGEKVHLLMHIPPGSGTCLKAWSNNFYKIVNRYENTIVNQFFGHSHHDWFQMFYDDITFQRPLGFGFVVPSVTSISSGNPAYRIYTIDGNYQQSSWAVLDFKNYYLNLTEANLHDDPIWTIEYSPKTSYNMKSVYAADWEDLLKRMKQDDNLFQIFYNHNQVLRPNKGCDAKCKEDLLCEMIEGRSSDPDLCKIHKL